MLSGKSCLVLQEPRYRNAAGSRKSSLTPAHQKMSSNGVTLRGRTPLYMSDGVPQSTSQRSGFTVDPAFIDRVEVIYGANAIQGVGSTGGIINYVTIDAFVSRRAL